MDDLIKKINELPNESGLYLAGWKHTSKGITPDAQPSGITTDEIKALVSELETKTRALERYASSKSWFCPNHIEFGETCDCPKATYNWPDANGFDIAQAALKSE